MSELHHIHQEIAYNPFWGSDRTKKVRKGLVDLIIPNAAGPNVFLRLFNSIMNNISYMIENSNGSKINGLRIIVVSQGECGSHELLQQLKNQFPQVIFPILKSRNVPPPVPYNDGLEYSARRMDPLSEFIMFLDDDMIVRQSGLIEAEKEHLEKYGFVNVATEHCFFGDKKKLGPNGESKDFGMGSFFFRRKLFEQVGYLDEYFHFHCSDTDYNRRIRLSNPLNKIAVIPDTDKYMLHEHQRGTHNFFKGNHQRVIDNDWALFGKKWYHEEHSNDDFDVNCPKCIAIKENQLPLGRIGYLFNDEYQSQSINSNPNL